MKTFTTTQEHQAARASQNEKINQYIETLKAQIKEAENARDGIIEDEPLQVNGLFNLLKSIENKDKVTEITAYPKAERKVKPLVRLSEANNVPDDNKMRAPIQKKDYSIGYAEACAAYDLSRSQIPIPIKKILDELTELKNNKNF